jgi:hypothetical protein
MKIVKVNNADIKLVSGKSFAYNTPPEMPKGHMVSIACGKRGAGKSVAITNLIKMLKYDRVLCISPTFKSNSILMKDLNINPNDVFEDADDPHVVDKIIKIIEDERDELETYLEQKKEYSKLLKMLNENYDNIPDEMLLMFYQGGQFIPPQHKYGGRNPFIALMIDDCQSSKLFTNKRIQNLTIKHRHIGAFNSDRPSIGVSLFFLVQNIKSKSGGLDRAIRNNSTNMLLFKNKDLAELDFIANEMAGEVDKTTFLNAYDYAMDDGEHPFLFIDLHKKQHHASMFRSRFNKFLVNQ